MSLLIEADWEKLNSGTPEERACFAAIGVKSNDIWITQAEDILVRRIRDKIYLSGYRLAEWLAWNWWRLRWEPRGHTLDWSMAHRMSTIGGGYIWPNISIVSDGERIAILAKSTEQVPQEPMRYIRDLAVVVQAKEFENTLDLFLSQISGQLRAESLADTNFEQIWSDVLAERNNPEVAKWRCLEALLGYDPGEAPESSLNRLLEDAKILGKNQ